MNLQALERKIQRGSELDREDGMLLWEVPLGLLGQWAQQRKEEKFGPGVSFIRNYYMNFTNICRYACKYCGFRRNKGDSDAYTLSLEEIELKLQRAPERLTEVWFSSGLNSELPYTYYLDLIKLVKRTVPCAHLKAFTAVEIDFIAKHFSKTHEEVLDEFFAAGLDRIPGGGAEMFDPEVRKRIDIKTRTEDYLRIHALCHQRDVPTNTTMLFGHVETRAHRISHMIQLREFQHRSKGVQAFIPLAYQDKNNPLAKRGVKGPSPVEILKTLAIARLMVDNVEHIQSFWVDSGEVVTQVSLHFGVDDINGTLIEENIAHGSGSPTKTYEPMQSLIDWIEGSGFKAWERDIYFNPVRDLS